MKAFSAPQCFIFSAALMSNAIISSHSTSFAPSSSSSSGAFAPSTLQKALSWSMAPSSATTVSAISRGGDSISHRTSDSNINSNDGSCHVNNQSGESSVAESVTQVFSAEDHVAFERDGFLVVSGLLEDQLEEFIHAGHAFAAKAKKTNSYFSIIDMGLIFQAGKDDTDSGITDAFRRVAFHSKLPQAAAELMQIPASQNVRVLRDVFMAKSIAQDNVCDWHVDDIGFWPESYDSKQDGINVWIAMDDMPAAYQGSMALSPGSHRADEWRFHAYEAIGQDRSTDGGFTKEDIQQKVSNGETLKSTCDLGKHAPDIRAQIEDTIFIPDLKKGDVIFATRTMFHRTLAVTEEGKAHYKEQDIEHLNRYSIRYVPGTAKLPSGWGFEWSIVMNGDNSGQSLDVVMDTDENMWYPRVWPTMEDDLQEGLDCVAANTLEDAKSKSRTEVFELITLFSKQ